MVTYQNIDPTTLENSGCASCATIGKVYLATMGTCSDYFCVSCLNLDVDNED